MSETLQKFWVVSPQYESGGDTYGDPPEPPEWGCDAIEIEAESKRDALILGVREFLKDHDSWASTNRMDGMPPWKGYRVEPSQPDCECWDSHENLYLNETSCGCCRNGHVPA